MKPAFRALLPNALTLLRLVAAVVFPFAPREWWLLLTLYAGLSDLVDGWLSRRWNSTSVWGQLLDPIADKAFVLSASITLVVAGWISMGEMIGLAARDITVLVLSVIAAFTIGFAASDHKPRWSGKVATAGQLAVLVALVALQRPLPALVWVAIVLSVIAAVDYTIAAARRLNRVG
jgi:cardiolipin synthase